MRFGTNLRIRSLSFCALLALYASVRTARAQNTQTSLTIIATTVATSPDCDCDPTTVGSAASGSPPAPNNEAALAPPTDPADGESTQDELAASISNDELRQAALRVDVALSEAARDLDLLPKRIQPQGTEPPRARELRALAPGEWIIQPQLTLIRDQVELSLTAAPPHSKVVFVRSQFVQLDELELRATVMLRDIVRAAGRGTALPADGHEPAAPDPDKRNAGSLTSNSPGRAPLALNGGLLGGYVGWTLQRTSGSTDARLTYPLIALGAGVGLGASMVAADEWDISAGDAWYLSAGIWWPMSSAILLSDAYHVSPTQDRFAYGLLGATSGLTLATTALVFSNIDEGGALVAHSGGAFGTALGGVSQLIKRGSTEAFPTRGAGFGAGIGVVAGGLLATQTTVEPSRVLFVDLSASLGGLIGAAAASPLLLVDEEEQLWRTRAWLSAIGGGILGGGVVGFLLTRHQTHSEPARAQAVQAWPMLGAIGHSLASNGEKAVAYGAGVQGLW